MTDEYKWYKNALDFTNTVRRKWDMDPIPELPPGLRGHSCECPVARGLELGASEGIKADVTQTKVVFGGAGYRVPAGTARFIRSFDASGYPELSEATNDL